MSFTRVPVQHPFAHANTFKSEAQPITQSGFAIKLPAHVWRARPDSNRHQTATGLGRSIWRSAPRNTQAGAIALVWVVAAAASANWATPPRMADAGFEPALDSRPLQVELQFQLRLQTDSSPTRASAQVCQANRKPSIFSPTLTSSTSRLFASSRANFTASCSRSTRSTSSLTRCAGSAPENFTVLQVPILTSS